MGIQIPKNHSSIFLIFEHLFPNEQKSQVRGRNPLVQKFVYHWRVLVYIYISIYFQEITAAPRFPQLSYAVGCRAHRASAASDAAARRRRRPGPPATPCRRSTGRHWPRWPRGSRRLKDTVAMGKHQDFTRNPKKG